MRISKDKPRQLGGIIPPIVTPVDADGKLDKDGLRRVIDHCIAGGVSGVFTMGSTGEAMRVPKNTWRDALSATIEHARGRTLVFCGVIDASTYGVLENIKEAEGLGAEYVVVTAPMYIQNCCQDEIIRHFERICAETKLNVVAYNIPGLAGTNILPQTLAAIAKIDNLVACKDSSADWEQFQRYLFLLEDSDISLFNGAEELCSAALTFGADGCVPGLACMFPKLFVDMFTAAKNGNNAEAYRLQKKVWEVRKSLFVGKSWLAAMKQIGHHLGLSSNQTTFPIEPLSDAERKAIDKIADEAR
jgi:4-hydroxy-tetrahydrodipicolinate synthase